MPMLHTDTRGTAAAPAPRPAARFRWNDEQQSRRLFLDESAVQVLPLCRRRARRAPRF